MSALAVRLSRAVAQGRSAPKHFETRAELLVTLLRKRAIARTHGAVEIEMMLRAQILWSLPMLRAADIAMLYARANQAND